MRVDGSRGEAWQGPRRAGSWGNGAGWPESAQPGDGAAAQAYEAEAVGRSHSVLYTLPQLDALTGGFEPGKVAFIESSSRFIFPLTTLMAFRGALEGNVVFVDGGNSVDPFGIARHCKARRIDPRPILSRVRVARAFTAHQLATLIDDRMESAVREAGAGTIIVSCLMDMFFDKDMPWRESRQMLRRSLEEIRAVARESEAAAIVTHYSHAPMGARLAALVDARIDLRLRLRQAGDTLFATSRYGSMAFRTGPGRWQRTLDQYGGPENGAHLTHV
jgi:hypothetical protein